jgi:hypothetical protein
MIYNYRYCSYYSIIVIIGVFILLNFYMRKRMMRRMGIGGAGAGVMFGSMSSTFGDNSLNYYCMSCGTKHKKLHVLNAVQK